MNAPAGPAAGTPPASPPMPRPEGVAASRLFVGRARGTWTLPEQIAAEIGERILDLAIAPGSRVPEEGLAREFGVSRGPIRDALRTLEQAGLIRITSRKGAVATPMTGQDLREIFQLRTSLTELALLGFARHAGTANLDHYRLLLRAIERHTEDDAMAIVWVEAIDRLILFLAHHCGNSRVAQLLTALSLQSVRYVRVGLQEGRNPVARRREIVRFYQDLLAACESGAPVEPFIERMRAIMGERTETIGSALA